MGLSTLNKWVNADRDTDVVSAEDRVLSRENERLRREIRILKEERDFRSAEFQRPHQAMDGDCKAYVGAGQLTAPFGLAPKARR